MMKILKLDEFLKLPIGTIYCEYEGGACRGLFRKWETLRNDDEEPCDFFCSSLIAEFANRGINDNGKNPILDGVCSRWAEFDHNKQFVVYEADDIAQLKSMLPP